MCFVVVVVAICRNIPVALCMYQSNAVEIILSHDSTESTLSEKGHLSSALGLSSSVELTVSKLTKPFQMQLTAQCDQDCGTSLEIGGQICTAGLVLVNEGIRQEKSHENIILIYLVIIFIFVLLY